MSRRKAAFLAGEIKYEGKPCKLGHVLRYTKSYHCVACRALIPRPYCAPYMKYWREKNPDKIRAYKKRYQAHEPPAQLQARRDRASAKRRALLQATFRALRNEGYAI